MNYNLDNYKEREKAKVKFNYLCSKKCIIELTQKRSSRSYLQNRALHQFYVLVAEELNELGMDFQYFGLKGQVLSTRYTPTIVKNQFWRPIQLTLFDIYSTKDINTIQINEIFDVIAKFFSERGVYIEFPNKDFLNNEKMQNMQG